MVRVVGIVDRAYDTPNQFFFCCRLVTSISAMRISQYVTTHQEGHRLLHALSLACAVSHVHKVCFMFTCLSLTPKLCLTETEQGWICPAMYASILWSIMLLTHWPIEGHQPQCLILTLGFPGNPIMLLFPPVRLLHILLPRLHLYPLFPLHPFRSMSQNNPDFTLESATSATSRK